MNFNFGKVLAALLAVAFFYLVLSLSDTYGQSVDLNAAPASGKAPLAVNLTWNASGVDTCKKDNVEVALTGSESKTVNVDTTYSIACTGGRNYTDINWTPPTEMLEKNETTGVVTKVPMPSTGPASLAGFEIYVSTNAATVESATPIVINDKNATTYRINGQPNSVYYYKLRAFNVAATKSEFTSSINNTIAYVQVADTAFVNILSFSTIQTAVYNVVKRDNGFVLVQVGTAPLNTNCDVNQYVNGYNAIPVSTVTWSGTVKPIVVVAKCSEH